MVSTTSIMDTEFNQLFHRANAGPKRYVADQLALAQASEPALVPVTAAQEREAKLTKLGDALQAC